MLGEGPKSALTKVYGWETVAEEYALVELVKQLPAKDAVIVELGGEYGRSASEFAYALRAYGKQGHVYTIDLFPTNHPVVGNLLDAWRVNISEAGYQEVCTPLRASTIEGAKVWAEHNTPIDLLFIDAVHTYEDVWQDIAAWNEFVKPGGIVAFHDYAQQPDAHPLHFEVKRAVDQWQTTARWVKYAGPDSLVWFVKPVEPVTVVGKVLAPKVDPPVTVEPKPKNKGGRPPKKPAEVK
jgi:predicted O-methyltransferase YrrM